MERLQTKARPDRDELITKATARRDLASFRAVIAKAVKWGMLEQNPIQQLRMKATKLRSEVRFLSPAEEQRLRATLTHGRMGIHAPVTPKALSHEQQQYMVYHRSKVFLI